ncbi:MAG: exo-alpha-sialidase [Verrucomicrobiaceae bacterium]|nr:MAG: exo-alpha-sialidase [Verrucomicrobiaceae bacterium]
MTDRRHFLTQSLGTAASLTLASKVSSEAGTKAAESVPAASAMVRETRVISSQPQFYHGWPTVARRRDGTLWVVWSGGREGHVCPFGQLVAMTSKDDGATWTRARVLHDGPLDDRDAGIVETAAGTLLATNFTSLAYEPILEKELKDAAAAAAAGKPGGRFSPEDRAIWKATRDFLTPEQRRAALGEWVLRSTDGGITWSAPIPTVVNSPHGPTVLRDGRLIYAGKQLWTPEGKIGVAESKDDGLSWQWLADIPTRPGDDATGGYHELHAVEAADGSLMTHIRKESAPQQGETLQSESHDGGRKWSEPHPIGVWGLPSHLLRLRDGRLMMTYGHRRPPFGNQARLSTDHGKTWGTPLSISADGIGGDLGYPSTVELGDGSLLTVWYEREPGLK